MKVKAKYIYDNFIAVGSPETVNVDNQARITVENGLKNPSADLFNLAQTQVFTLMKLDCYPRFFKSNLYKECLRLEQQEEPLPFQFVNIKNEFDFIGQENKTNKNAKQIDENKNKLKKKLIYSWPKTKKNNKVPEEKREIKFKTKKQRPNLVYNCAKSSQFNQSSFNDLKDELEKKLKIATCKPLNEDSINTHNKNHIRSKSHLKSPPPKPTLTPLSLANYDNQISMVTLPDHPTAIKTQFHKSPCHVNVFDSNSQDIISSDSFSGENNLDSFFQDIMRASQHIPDENINTKSCLSPTAIKQNVTSEREKISTNSKRKPMLFSPNYEDNINLNYYNLTPIHRSKLSTNQFMMNIDLEAKFLNVKNSDMKTSLCNCSLHDLTSIPPSVKYYCSSIYLEKENYYYSNGQQVNSPSNINCDIENLSSDPPPLPPRAKHPGPPPLPSPRPPPPLPPRPPNRLFMQNMYLTNQQVNNSSCLV